MDNSFYDKFINRIIDKRYKIENVVGVGGMAYVLKATDLTTGREVAVKILSDEYRDDERAVKRFVNESKTIAMLDHENIVKIWDVVLNDDMKYIVMEFIDGITLKDYVDKIGTLNWKEAVYYIKQVLRALSHAHEKQVIHRDIKPQNIMLLSDGTVKVTDFGIAKQPNAESITMTDKAIGTVNYISPEQASGGKVDFRSDIYSVGIMLYEMVTGRLPFIAESPVAVAMMQVSSMPTPPREINSQIPVGLEQIILKSMEKAPENRFVNSSAMLKALDYFSENPDVVFAAASSSEKKAVTSDEEKKGKKKKEKYENEEKRKARLKKQVRGSRAMFPITSGIATAFVLVGVLFLIFWVLPFFKGTEKKSDDESLAETIESGFSTAVDRMLGVDGSNSSDRKVTVKDYIGQKYDDSLITEIEDYGFTVDKVEYVRNPKYGSNEVVRQEPEANAVKLRPDAGRPIPMTLYVNMGEEEMIMPDLSLMLISDAKKLLRTRVNSLSLNELSLDSIQVIEEFHDTYPAEFVIRTLPVAEEIVKLGNDVTFTVYVSKGQKITNTTVPELEGIELPKAKQAILNSKLALGRISYEESDTVGANLVIRASHAKGETVAQGITAIDLWVSIGSSKAVPKAEERAVTPATPKEPEVPQVTEAPVENTQNPSQNGQSNENGQTASENPPSESGSPTEATPSGDLAGLLDMRNEE